MRSYSTAFVRKYHQHHYQARGSRSETYNRCTDKVQATHTSFRRLQHATYQRWKVYIIAELWDGNCRESVAWCVQCGIACGRGQRCDETPHCALRTEKAKERNPGWLARQLNTLKSQLVADFAIENITGARSFVIYVEMQSTMKHMICSFVTLPLSCINKVHWIHEDSSNELTSTSTDVIFVQEGPVCLGSFFLGLVFARWAQLKFTVFSWENLFNVPF